jgi:aminoglycoside phosphotransferase (APT) family kinase protein
VSTDTAVPLLDAGALATIGRLLGDAGTSPAGPLRASLIAGGRSNLTFRISDGATVWVLRTPPRAGRTPSAHDVAREFRVTKALGDTGFPVPRALVLCEDEKIIGGPFTIAEFVAGRTIQTRDELDRLDDASVGEAVEALVKTLASLHAVDHVAIGLERFGPPGGYVERQLTRWSGQWELVGAQKLLALGEEVIAHLRGNVPTQQAVGIVHGDFRIDNTLLAPGTGHLRVAAVIDWELSTIGNPVADVAMMCAYRDTSFDLVVGAPSAWTSDRLPGTEGLAEAYTAAGGVDLVDWESHMALAYFKIAVIAAGIDHRVRAGAASGPGFDSAGQAVEPYLLRARAVLS